MSTKPRKSSTPYLPFIDARSFSSMLSTDWPLSPEMDGQFGSNRVPIPQGEVRHDNPAGARTDLEAINAWLSEYKDSPATFTNYSKEAHRLYVWTIAGLGKPLSSLTRADMMAYFDFLHDPQPVEHWCGSPCPKWLADGTPNSAWRPFNGGLSASSINTAQVILKSLFQWLVDAEYLHRHPLALMRRRKGKLSVGSAEPRPERVFDTDMEVAIWQAVDQLPRKTTEQERIYERGRWLVALLLYSGLRRAEIHQHTMANIRRIDDHWWIEVLGKGGRRRRVPVPWVLLEALKRFRRFLDLSPLPDGSDQTPLAPYVRENRGGTLLPINSRQLNQVVKPIVWAAADILEPDLPQKAGFLRQSSPHWFRHTYATTLLSQGADAKVVQINMGHASFGTTAIYQHVQTPAQHNATTEVFDS